MEQESNAYSVHFLKERRGQVKSQGHGSVGDFGLEGG